MNFKQLIEKRNALVEKVNAMFVAVEKENRAFNEAETAEYEAISKEIKDIDATIRMADAAKGFGVATAKEQEQTQFEKESRSLAAYLKAKSTGMEYRGTDVNMTTGDNGAIIPSTIAAKIIETVENIAPVFNLTTKYSVKGTLNFPVYNESVDKVQCAYATEFTAIDSHTGKFTSLPLKGYLVGALTKISRSLMTNAEFDVVSYIVGKVSLAIARFLEHEVLLGAGNNAACTGVLVSTNVETVTTAAATAITADDLIDAQMAVAEQYQSGCCWVMNKAVFKAIRKLKDKDDNYILNKDLTMGFGYELLGKHVYLSDAMESTIATGKKVAVYADFSGVFTNLRPGFEMQMLNEKYADEHAVGVVTWYEVDSNVFEKQKVAVLKMA